MLTTRGSLVPLACSHWSLHCCETGVWSEFYFPFFFQHLNIGKKMQLCDDNLLKPYYGLISLPSSCHRRNIPMLQVWLVLLTAGSSHSLLEVHVCTNLSDQVLLHIRQSKPQALECLDELLGHLYEVHRTHLKELIQSFSCLFWDTAVQTHFTEHHILAVDVKPIKQKFYHMHGERWKFFDAEFKYVLEHGLA